MKQCQNQYQQYLSEKPHCFLVKSKEDAIYLKLLGHSCIIVASYDTTLVAKLQGKKVIIASSISGEGFEIADRFADSLKNYILSKKKNVMIQSLHILKLGDESIVSLQQKNALISFLSNVINYECIFQLVNQSKPKNEAKPKKQGKLHEDFERMKKEIPEVQKLADLLGLEVIG